MAAITVSGLSKNYDGVLANDDVSFDIETGEVFGYLGPNGAGKTTTIRTLMGFQSPSNGTATVLDADIQDGRAMVAVKQRIGYLPANPQLDESATGMELLDLHQSIKGGERREELLALFDVPVERKIRGYSTGQTQKLGLVQAFMHDPDLVVMDEPTSGLDPLVQQQFNEFVREEKRAGTTVFLSSHVLSEVRRVCDRIGIIRNGKIVTVEDVEDLLHRSGKSVRIRVASDIYPEDVSLDGVHDLTVKAVEDSLAETALAAGSGSRSAFETITELGFTYTGDFDSLIDFADRFHVLEFDVEEAPLEQVFMRFYGDDASQDSQGGDA